MTHPTPTRQAPRETRKPFQFDVVSGDVVSAILSADHPQIVDVVRSAYLAHHQGDSVNPRSYFLRFPEKPEARIIALPAYLGSDYNVAGIKWIGSFPKNIDTNIPRASAVLILNDYETGYPIACIEASQISAARTAASAVLGAEHLAGGRTTGRVLVVGAGVLGRTVVDFFAATGWSIGELLVHDAVGEYARSLADHAAGHGLAARVSTDPDGDIRASDVVVFVTTAPEPWITDPGAFRPGQVVLNVSLRDLAPAVIASAHNVVDDVDHVLNANSAPHLAQQEYGHVEFIDGTLAGLIEGEFALSEDKPKIFSPFGLGVLDLAVGHHVHQTAVANDQTTRIADFFAEASRWG